MNKENNFPHFGLCTNRELCILCTLHHFAKSLRNYLEQLHNNKTWVFLPARIYMIIQSIKHSLNNWSKRCANKNDWRRQNQMQELNVSKLITWWFSTKWKWNLGSELFEVLCSAVIAVSPDSALWTDFTSSDINFLNQLPKTCTSPFILKYINAIAGYRGGQIWNMN